jgi:hypothetical protein
MSDTKMPIAKIKLRAPHHWDNVGDAGDGYSTVYKCKVCGCNATSNGRPNDKDYPPCKYVTTKPKGMPVKPISSESPGIEPPWVSVYLRGTLPFEASIPRCSLCPCHVAYPWPLCGLQRSVIKDMPKDGTLPASCPLHRGPFTLRKGEK